ncbi:MAG TPA: hypothetical protein VMG09_11890 [Bacteroidota bacterium]|nr:hypothetical protein [Bacteroidota bacterium]
MKNSRTGVFVLIAVLFVGLALTMSGASPRGEYRLVNVGGMGNHCQCTSRIEQ